MQQGAEGKCRQLLVQLKSAWDFWGPFKSGDFLSKQEEPLDLRMTQFLVYRIGKIDDIVRLDALQISQTIKGALERFLYQYCHP